MQVESPEIKISFPRVKIYLFNLIYLWMENLSRRNVTFKLKDNIVRYE